MNRRRTTARTLTGTRIYIRRGWYQYFSEEEMLNKKTGAVTKWHKLCPVADGERKARQARDELLGIIAIQKGQGDFVAWFDKWRTEQVIKREKQAPKEPMRLAIWNNGTKALCNVLGVIESDFVEFDVNQVTPSNIAAFVDQWEGRRAAQVYRGHLAKFFEWCCRRGLIHTNPAREVSVETPKKREVYFESKAYVAVKNELIAAGTHNSLMIAALMDLLYLFYQRGTDVRLLKSNELDGETITFVPTKTEKSSGAAVTVSVTQEAKEIVARLRAMSKLRSIYLIHDDRGQPFSSRKARDIFHAACKRAGVIGFTLKDIRSKAATDAKEAGYSEEQLKTALAHTNGATTRGYIRKQKAAVSEVVLTIPKG